MPTDDCDKDFQFSFESKNVTVTEIPLMSIQRVKNYSFVAKHNAV